MITVCSEAAWATYQLARGLLSRYADAFVEFGRFGPRSNSKA